MRKIELVAPAGNMEKLQMAVLYGADAVYLAGESYSLRSSAGNFNNDEMRKGIRFAHSKQCKVYLAVNAYARNSDLDSLPDFIRKAAENGADAVIVSDPGILNIVRDAVPDIPIHLSTQANTMNYASALFWHRAGVGRIILARELSLKEITQIRRKAPADLELEVFVHGAVCISYSGRCYLSDYLALRSSNAGSCAQPCRWKYSLVEEKRPGQYMPVFEDPNGAYIMNTKDLCMISHIPELAETGANSFKIEGRMKSSYYTAIVTKVYREAIDSYYSDPEHWHVRKEWLDEICRASRRECDTGFYFGQPGHDSYSYTTDTSDKEYEFIGIVTGYDQKNGLVLAEQRNRFFQGDRIEIVPPKGLVSVLQIECLFDEDGRGIDSAPHPRMNVKIPSPVMFPTYSIIRRKPGR